MSDRADRIAAAGREGRAAEPGAVNPYAGDGAVALSWDLGYRAMLAEKMQNSTAARLYAKRDNSN